MCNATLHGVPLQRIVSMSSDAPHSLVLLTDQHNAYATISVDANGRASMTSHGSLVHSSSHTAAASFLLAADNGDLLIVSSHSSTGCALSIALFAIGSRAHITAARPASNEWCALQSTPSSISIVAEMSHDMLSVDVMASFAHDTDGIGMLRGRATRANTTASFVFEPAGSDVALRMGVGRAPSLAIARSPRLNNASVVLQLHTDSYCWNSHKLNTRSPIALCSSTPVSISQVGTYTYGRFDSFADAIAQRRSFSACDEQLLHGAFGQTLLTPVGGAECLLHQPLSN
jgi:hypothetical protein